MIERMARENTAWGYRRIQSGLLEPGHRTAASTVHRVLKRLRDSARHLPVIGAVGERSAVTNGPGWTVGDR
ncbi:hypothetical protein [Saccharothrix sp. ALI-22-I]|uniref:hypothetical protein n=1 Tax=Saccharothrix sp. ALI-22-I TaxID=1933778 RepID=UPI001EE6C204|nr:hypothetical protein [Saccharothrix sp. ALI-22-I]